MEGIRGMESNKKKLAEYSFSAPVSDLHCTGIGIDYSQHNVSRLFKDNPYRKYAAYSLLPGIGMYRSKSGHADWQYRYVCGSSHNTG